MFPCHPILTRRAEPPHILTLTTSLWECGYLIRLCSIPKATRRIIYIPLKTKVSMKSAKCNLFKLLETTSKLVRCLIPLTYPALTSPDDSSPVSGLPGAGEVFGRSNIAPQTNRHTGHMTNCMCGAAPVAQGCGAKSIKTPNSEAMSTSHCFEIPISCSRGCRPHGQSDYSKKLPQISPSTLPV